MMFHAVVSNIAGGTGTAYRAVIARQAGHIQFLSIKLLFLFNPNQYQLNIAGKRDCAYRQQKISSTTGFIEEVDV